MKKPCAWAYLFCKFAVVIYLPILDRNHGRKRLCRSLIGFFCDALTALLQYGLDTICVCNASIIMSHQASWLSCVGLSAATPYHQASLFFKMSIRAATPGSCMFVKDNDCNVQCKAADICCKHCWSLLDEQDAVEYKEIMANYSGDRFVGHTDNEVDRMFGRYLQRAELMNSIADHVPAHALDRLNALSTANASRACNSHGRDLQIHLDGMDQDKFKCPRNASNGLWFDMPTLTCEPPADQEAADHTEVAEIAADGQAAAAAPADH